ncbi:MAG TPA: hypothetical protein VIM08_12935 [Arthrobacter sp.]|jgi:hypothetical protein
MSPGVVAVADDDVPAPGPGDLAGDRGGGEGGSAVAVDGEPDGDKAKAADDFRGDFVQKGGAGPEEAGPLSGQFREEGVV